MSMLRNKTTNDLQTLPQNDHKIPNYLHLLDNNIESCQYSESISCLI